MLFRCNAFTVFCTRAFRISIYQNLPNDFKMFALLSLLPVWQKVCQQWTWLLIRSLLQVLIVTPEMESPYIASDNFGADNISRNVEHSVIMPL